MDHRLHVPRTHSNQGCQLQICVITHASDQLAISEVPISPSLGSSDLLDRLRELRKPIYLLDHLLS